MEKEKKEAYRSKIITKYGLEKGQIIDYSLFKEIYEKYKDEIDPRALSEILGIKFKTYLAFREKADKGETAKVRILMDVKLSDKEKEKILNILVAEYKLYKGKQISYDTFRQYYKRVSRYFTEPEFASLLGISDTNLRNIRNTLQKAKVFKRRKVSPEEKELIRENLLKKYECKRIYMVEDKAGGSLDFYKLYEPYKLDFSILEFAELLGISEKNVSYARRNLANPMINNSEALNIAKKIREDLDNPEYLSEEEINGICVKYDLTVDEFIRYYINKGKFYDSSIYLEALTRNHGLFVKNCSMKEEDFVKFSQTINDIVRSGIELKVNRRYGNKYLNQDLEEEMKLFMLYSCGDIVGNFSYDEDQMRRLLYARTGKFAQIYFIEKFRNDIKKEPYDEENTMLQSRLLKTEERRVTIDENNMDEIIETFKLYLEATNQSLENQTVGTSKEKLQAKKRNLRLAKEFFEVKESREFESLITKKKEKDARGEK